MRVGLEFLRDLRRIGHSLRRHDDQHAVDVRIFRRNFQRLRVALRLGVSQDVNGIGVRPRGGQEFVVRIHTLGRDLGERAAALHQRVRGENAGATRVGHDAQPVALGARLLGKHIGHVENVGDGIDAQDADAAEGRIQHIV